MLQESLANIVCVVDHLGLESSMVYAPGIDNVALYSQHNACYVFIVGLHYYTTNCALLVG